MVIPEETIRDESHLVFNVFQSKNLFYDQDQDEIMSPVVSLLNNRAEQNTSVEIRFDLNDTNSSYFCASWLRFPNDSAKWLPEECRTIAQNEFHLTCRCTFLRPFALFRVTQSTCSFFVSFIFYIDFYSIENFYETNDQIRRTNSIDRYFINFDLFIDSFRVDNFYLWLIQVCSIETKTS